MIYTYKLHGEVLEIVKENTQKARKSRTLENKKILRTIKRNILDQYDTEESINLIFKLLCESCGNSYPFSDDIFTIICYFLSNLMDMKHLSIQNKLLILFEKRAYSQKFFKHIYTYLTSHTKKLNTQVTLWMFMDKTLALSLKLDI